jgi:hypothetical protein
VFQAWATQSGVFLLPHVVLVRLHALLLDLTQDIFVLFAHRKWIVANVLYVRLEETLSVAFPWVSNVIDQRSTGNRVSFRLRQRRQPWLTLSVCDVFKVFEVGKHVHVFDSIFDHVEFPTLSVFNASGCAANSQIPLSCNLEVFSIV